MLRIEKLQSVHSTSPMVDGSKGWSTTGSEKQSHAAKIFRVKDQWWIADESMTVHNAKLHETMSLSDFM